MVVHWEAENQAGPLLGPPSLHIKFQLELHGEWLCLKRKKYKQLEKFLSKSAEFTQLKIWALFTWFMHIFILNLCIEVIQMHKHVNI